MFADDTTVTNSHRSEKFLQYAITHVMGLLMDWFDADKLSLNLNKTVMIQFWPSKTKLGIKVGDVEIPLVNSAKFLGVIMDENLTCNEHISHLEAKLNTNKHLLRTTKNYSLPDVSSQSITTIYTVTYNMACYPGEAVPHQKTLNNLGKYKIPAYAS